MIMYTFISVKRTMQIESNRIEFNERTTHDRTHPFQPLYTNS